MKIETYEITSEDDFFLFFSIGTKGVFPKVIVYETITPNIYNLVFGDLNVLTGEVSDLSTTNNGDMPKIIATVVKSIVVFLEKNPSAQVNFKGSTGIRTKLYQRVIVNYGSEFLKKYLIFGIEEGKKEPSIIDFTKNYIEFNISKA